MTPNLLTARTVIAYLAGRGLLRPDERAEVCELGGGVSNVVLGVDTGARRLVVKQARARLVVEDEWLAKRERAVTEAAALDLAGTLVSDSAPALLDVDPAACVLVVAWAPPAWSDWKTRLLRGEVDVGVAVRLGEILAVWHAATAQDPDTARAFDDAEAFEQLRVDPYHRTVMRRRPDLAAAVGAYVERMGGGRRCVVHGDYSPKNVLVGPSGRLWVIDFEVAHFGDPAFDVAFMLNHLLLKAVHRPQDRSAYRSCALAFWGAYAPSLPPDLRPDARYVLGHAGCLMVARVDGKSPAEYLSDQGRQQARRLGAWLLLDPPADLESAWRRLEDGAG